MKTVLKLCLLLLTIYLFVTPSCEIFEFRERCKGTKEEFRDSIKQNGLDYWNEDQKVTFYSNIIDDTLLFYWNTGVYFNVCVENSINASVQAVLNKNKYYQPEVHIIVETTANERKKEVRVAKPDSDWGLENYYSEKIALDFNRTDNDPLYGSVNVQTKVFMPVPPDWDTDVPENRAWAIYFIESVVQEIYVQIEYIY